MTSELREPTFYVLAALADGRKHGYGIIKDTVELSGGRISLNVGTLYSALERLSGDGLVARDGEEVVDGRLRRYFRLTDDGAALLAEEADRLAARAASARERLAHRRPAASAGAAAGALS
ncbi:PadR family transcriptional regulator [Leifsonia sp. NCR5]|uniref:PadR family transcriptional regulator n=1 Tax=Leifsonia sp. NCR5 TaxID=1978342 RepID=UPI000A193D92|nr:PadR family transcriptional regulator [Leifsonia sp. NCR5]